MEGVSHTIEVTAATLYEAVARGLAAIRRNEWVASVAEGSNTEIGEGLSSHLLRLRSKRCPSLFRSSANPGSRSSRKDALLYDLHFLGCRMSQTPRFHFCPSLLGSHGDRRFSGS